VKPVLVIAGHYREFLEWCRENEKNPQDRGQSRYISSPEELYGWTRPVTLIFYGTYLKRRDWDVLYYVAKELL
jgi:hypothetical protein